MQNLGANRVYYGQLEHSQWYSSRLIFPRINGPIEVKKNVAVLFWRMHGDQSRG